MNILLTPPRTYTPEEFYDLPDDGRSYELVDGQLVEKPMSMRSSRIAGRIVCLLGNHCDAHDAGGVYTGDQGGYQCFPNQPKKVRKPDVSFIRKDRQGNVEDEEGWARIPPDLAVETISPNETVDETDERILDFLAAGVQLVWIVRPRSRMVEVHRADGTSSLLREHQEITGENVLSGFRCRVADFFQVHQAAAPTAP